jgi:hypothetical protein
MSSAKRSDEQLRRFLNERDIQLLKDEFLCALNDMQHIDSENFRFTEVYDRMGLGTYYLPLAMRVIIEEHLLHQQLIEITNEGSELQIQVG